MSQLSDYVTKLKGKDYLVVAGRIKAFREAFPISGEMQGRILTERQQGPGGRETVKASIYIGETLVATGHAQEPENMKSSHIQGRVLEKVETSAIGRALGCAGFGTDLFLEDEEDTFIADAPRENRKAPRSNPSTARNGKKLKPAGPTTAQLEEAKRLTNSLKSHLTPQQQMKAYARVSEAATFQEATDELLKIKSFKADLEKVPA